MATKVHPQAPLSASSCYTSSRQETFTIWMKSLVLNGNGCTVFDSRGEIVYRVDNYNSKCRDDVYLMDFKGKVVFTILRKVKRSVTHTYMKRSWLTIFHVFLVQKKFKLFRFWEGYRSSTNAARNQEEKLGFQVKEPLQISRGKTPCEVVDAGLEENDDEPCRYHIQSTRTSKRACKIVDNLGRTIAEVRELQ